MISNFLQKIICCPKCQKPLLVNENSLNCLDCQKQYPLINNIPVFENIDFKKYKLPKNLPAKNPFQYAPHFQLHKKYLLKYLKPQAKDAILDIGCGMGHYLDTLSKFSKNLVGLDNDLIPLLYAQKTTRADYILSKGEKMPFKNNSFDKLISFFVLEHIQDDCSAVKEMWRVGKNKAKVLIMVPASEKPRIHSVVKSMHGKGSAKHFREDYYMKEIKKLLNEAGIRVITARYTMFLFVEFFTELTRRFYSKKQKTYERQTDLFRVTKGNLFSLYKIVAPIIGRFVLLEDFLFSRSKKGYTLVIKGEIQK